MGDRGNIVMQYNGKKEQRIYFYGHWSGCDMPGILQGALKKRVRWDDDSYLSRIVFDALTKGRQGEETGFGISPFITDNEHDLLVVDLDNKKVVQETEGGSFVREWTFDQFCALNIEQEFQGY